MNLEITRDSEIIKKVMTDSDIWSKISIDNVEKSDFNPEIPANIIFLAAFVSDVIGLHMFTSYKNGVLYHPMLLKPYRKDYGREFFSNGIKWFFDNTDNDSLGAEIPISHKSTINLAKHLNFKDLGIRKNGILKNGNYLDLQILRLEKWAA
ncbi:MAG: hypothetical protein E2O80_06320 [Betaproteobacteria bacterium]|jgi:hypothetical protein|nr:MAG: hypothetical protein E2O80_06320 [Betaproteobacteria bacterium]